MPIIGLDDAINEILRIVNQKKISPFVFMVGAGLSCPNVPTAKAIISMAKANLKSRDHKTTNSEDEYSYWFQKAYPAPETRRQFLEKLIRKAKLTNANMELANLLISLKVSNIVLTTNFDEQIENSLSLFGQTHYYSSRNHVDNIGLDFDSNCIQVVHLHGTAKDYDCRNLSSEISTTDSNLYSMEQIVRNYLRNKAFIVIGYSGLYNDIFMNQLKLRFQSQVPYNYYWFCYDKEDYAILPNWLKENGKVKFILPTSIEIKYPNYILSNRQFSDFYGKLEASSVLKKISIAFGVEEPNIFKNPFLPLDYHLSNVDFDSNSFGLKDFKSKIDQLKKVYNDSTGTISNIYASYRNNDFRKLITLLIKFYKNNLVATENELDDINYNIVIKIFEEVSDEDKNRLANLMIRLPGIRSTKSSFFCCLRAILYKFKTRNNGWQYKSVIIRTIKLFDGLPDDYMHLKCIFIQMKFYYIIDSFTDNDANEVISFVDRHINNKGNKRGIAIGSFPFYLVLKAIYLNDNYDDLYKAYELSKTIFSDSSLKDGIMKSLIILLSKEDIDKNQTIENLIELFGKKKEYIEIVEWLSTNKQGH